LFVGWVVSCTSGRFVVFVDYICFVLAVEVGFCVDGGECSFDDGGLDFFAVWVVKDVEGGGVVVKGVLVCVEGWVCSIDALGRSGRARGDGRLGVVGLFGGGCVGGFVGLFVGFGFGKGFWFFVFKGQIWVDGGGSLGIRWGFWWGYPVEVWVGFGLSVTDKVDNGFGDGDGGGGGGGEAVVA
jgi:hypothetical protein